MADIRIGVDPDGRFSLFEVAGEVTAAEIVAAMDRQYTGAAPPHALWDYSEATFASLSADDYTRIALAAKSHAPRRAGGRTAFVASSRSETIAIRLLAAISDVVELPIRLRLFANRHDAIRWLSGGTEDGNGRRRP